MFRKIGASIGNRVQSRVSKLSRGIQSLQGSVRGLAAEAEHSAASRSLLADERQLGEEHEKAMNEARDAVAGTVKKLQKLRVKVGQGDSSEQDYTTILRGILDATQADNFVAAIQKLEGVAGILETTKKRKKDLMELYGGTSSKSEQDSKRMLSKQVRLLDEYVKEVEAKKRLLETQDWAVKEFNACVSDGGGKPFVDRYAETPMDQWAAMQQDSERHQAKLRKMRTKALKKWLR